MWLRRCENGCITIEASKQGITVTITDGVATYHDLSNPCAPYHSALCIATVSCAAISVRASEAEDLTRTALMALYNAGVAVVPAMTGYWTGLTGSNRLPWQAVGNQSAVARQLQTGTTECTYLTDKRRSWCEAGWMRMKGSLDQMLFQSGWGADFNMFYACAPQV